MGDRRVRPVAVRLRLWSRWRSCSRFSTSIPSRARRTLCVIVPARNEETLIGRCVKSVLDAGIDPAHVYAVDDESTDRTGEVLRGFAGVNVLRNDPRKGKAGSIRHAIEHFGLVERYTFVAILDADSHVSPGYFDAVLERVRRRPRRRPGVRRSARPGSQLPDGVQNARVRVEPRVVPQGSGQHRGHHRRARVRIDLPFLDPRGARLGRRHARRGHGPDRPDPPEAARSREIRQRRDRLHPGPATYSRVHRAAHTLVQRNVAGDAASSAAARAPASRRRIALLIGEGLVYSALVLAIPVLAWLWPARDVALDAARPVGLRGGGGRRAPSICAGSTSSCGFPRLPRSGSSARSSFCARSGWKSSAAERCERGFRSPAMTPTLNRIHNSRRSLA